LPGVAYYPNPMLCWLAGLYPQYLLERERERWRARVRTLPPDHHLWRRLRSLPYKGWSRIHQLAADAQPGPVWEPRRPGPRALLGLPSNPLRPRKIPLPDITSWWRSNKPQSSLWDGPSAKPFLALFDRKCLARWVAEAPGHGDFQEYRLRFNHPPSAIKTRPSGSMAPRGHFLRCPLSSFSNHMAGRLDPRAFWHSHLLFENRRVQLELYGSARDEQTGRTIPILPPPVSSLAWYNTPKTFTPSSDS